MSLHCSILHPLPRFLRPPVSLSAQLLTTWVVDLLWAYISLYNTVMKIFFIASSVYILYQMKGQYRPTNDFNLDTFKVEFLVLGSFVAAMVFNYAYNMPEVFPSKGVDCWCRFSGRLVFGLRVLRYYPNCSLFRGRVRQKTSRHIIYSRWGCIERCTFRIGCIDTFSRIILIQYRLWRDLFR